MNLLNLIIKPIYAVAGVDVVGTLQVPGGVPSDYTKTGIFVSSLIKFIIIVGGVFSLWQFLTGGFQFISSAGDKGKIAEAQQKINMSLIGLVTMAASFIIIAIISMLLFGSFTAILSPTLESVN